MKPETRNSKLSFLISAGEASGETYGAQLIAAIKRILPDPAFFGLGGEQMRRAGCNTVVDASDVAVVGLAEVVSHLPRIYGEFHKLLRAVDERRPTAAVLVDFPDFNFRLARQLHRRGILVFYFVSPQLWAWRQGRIRLVKKYVRKMLVIFPFEEEFYRARGVEAEYVGHPLADIPQPEGSRGNFATANGLNPQKHWIAVLPGSRRKEVKMNLPEMLRAAQLLNTHADGCEFVLPVAPTISQAWLAGLAREVLGQGGGIHLACVYDGARPALAHSRAAMVASGTATVEAALIGTPFVMVYRVSDLTWKLGRRLVKVPHFGMVNLIAGREVVPELVQAEFTAERVASKLRKLINEGADRERMLVELAEVSRILHPGLNGVTAADRAAQAIVRGLA